MSNSLVDTLDFEWNVFEAQHHQYLDWQQTSTSPLSPESMVSPKQLPRDLNSMNQDHESPRSGSSTDGDSVTANAQKNPKSPDRRRSQNRKAQRAFRQRQKQHTESLEQRLQSILSDYEELQQNYTRLQIDYNSLLRDKEMKNQAETMAFTQGWRVDGPSGNAGGVIGGEKDGAFEIDEYLLSDDGMRWTGM